MIKDLILVANILDTKGHSKEADVLDKIISRASSTNWEESSEPGYDPGPAFYSIGDLELTEEDSIRAETEFRWLTRQDITRAESLPPGKEKDDILPELALLTETRFHDISIGEEEDFNFLRETIENNPYAGVDLGRDIYSLVAPKISSVPLGRPPVDEYEMSLEEDHQSDLRKEELDASRKEDVIKAFQEAVALSKQLDDPLSEDQRLAIEGELEAKINLLESFESKFGIKVGDLF
jgi:hypothetical protein